MKLHPICEQILEQRGITDVAGFLNPPKTSDPAELPGVRIAAQRIFEAVNNGERICIHGDYDVDGMTGTSIMMLALRNMGANVNYFLPDRTDGYGMSVQNAKTISRMHDLIITVDCGIQNHEAIKAAQCDVIVTDHHTPGKSLPLCKAIVHPGIYGYEHPYLCGAAVALKLVTHMFMDGATISQPTLQACLALAAFGTIADVVPMIGENRAIVKRGLRNAEMIQTAYQMLDSKGFIKSEDVGFKLGPKLNAIGRMDDARHGVALLLGDSSKVAFAEELNEKRKEEQRQILEQALEQAEYQKDQGALVVSGKWNAGIVGIIAGRLSEKYKMPTVVIAEGEESCSGSARSAMGVPINVVLEQCKDFLNSHGGHPGAAGCKLIKDLIPEFRRKFQQEVGKCEKVDTGPSFDMNLDLEDTSLGLAYSLDELEPYGHQFPKPVFKTTTVVREASELKNNTLKLELMGNERAIGFGMGEKAEHLHRGEAIDVLYTLGWSEWRGERKKELMIKEIL